MNVTRELVPTTDTDSGPRWMQNHVQKRAHTQGAAIDAVARVGRDTCALVTDADCVQVALACGHRGHRCNVNMEWVRSVLAAECTKVLRTRITTCLRMHAHMGVSGTRITTCLRMQAHMGAFVWCAHMGVHASRRKRMIVATVTATRHDARWVLSEKTSAYVCR